MLESIVILILIILGVLFLIPGTDHKEPLNPPVNPAKKGKDTPISFADIFNTIIDNNSAAYFGHQRDKHRIDMATSDLKKEANEVAIDGKINDLDRKTNETTATANNFDKKVIDTEHQQNKRELDIDQKIALHEVDIEKAELKRQQFLDYLDRKFWELAQKEKEIAIAEYFFNKYRTLEEKEINLLHKKNKLELEKDRLNIQRLIDKADIKEQRAQLRIDAINLVTRDGLLKVRESEYRFLELKAVKYLGYPSLEAYYSKLRELDNLSREYGYNSLTNFGSWMLQGGQLNDLLSYKNAYLELESESNNNNQ